METEIQQLLAESMLEDVFGDFVLPEMGLDVDHVAMEQDLMALLQAEGLIGDDDLTAFPYEYIGYSAEDESGPYNGLEELLRQNTSVFTEESSSSGYCSPSSIYSGQDSVDKLSGGSLPDLDSVDCYFSDDYCFDSYQDDSPQKVQVFHVSPIKKESPALGVYTPPKQVTIKKDTPKKDPPKRDPPKKDVLRGVRKRGATKEKVKKEQNKMAAMRYRNKKKEEEVCMLTEYEELLEHNENLKKIVLDKEQEVKVLKQLLLDVIAK